jgi:tetrahydromethanopterin S-methyltransferase subunit F
MNPARMDGLIYGILLAVVAIISILITLAELRRKKEARDGEILHMTAGFALFCAIFAVVLLTGWVDLLPLPQ